MSNTSFTYEMIKIAKEKGHPLLLGAGVGAGIATAIALATGGRGAEVAKAVGEVAGKSGKAVAEGEKAVETVAKGRNIAEPMGKTLLESSPALKSTPASVVADKASVAPDLKAITKTDTPLQSARSIGLANADKVKPTETPYNPGTSLPTAGQAGLGRARDLSVTPAAKPNISTERMGAGLGTFSKSQPVFGPTRAEKFNTLVGNVKSKARQAGKSISDLFDTSGPSTSSTGWNWAMTKSSSYKPGPFYNEILKSSR